ncbi:hypothetical protein GWI33_007237 [Rhynchophorus ferrugineus]|uniref:Uncharacterized protein n=1 Tax=Rhynchophorus ferrugineus TaxID=354439 RepID=A0A834IEW9_RHYFE|nr:hypothetical protein GWI33_007237 [Rhynchophorus ferrugineus]
MGISLIKQPKKSQNRISYVVIQLAELQSYIKVNGAWSSWSSWSDCRCPGEPFGKGKMSTRTCNNPPPSNGGLPCQGTSIRRTADCKICPQVLTRPNLTIFLILKITSYPIRSSRKKKQYLRLLFFFKATKLCVSFPKSFDGDEDDEKVREGGRHHLACGEIQSLNLLSKLQLFKAEKPHPLCGPMPKGPANPHLSIGWSIRAGFSAF